MSARLTLFALMFSATVAMAKEPLDVPPPPPEEHFLVGANGDLEQRLLDMEAELVRLRRQLAIDDASVEPVGWLPNSPACDDPCLFPAPLTCDQGCCGTSGCDSLLTNTAACGEPTLYVGLDFAILEPHVGALRLPRRGVTVTPDQDHEIAPRVYAGFETASGLGGQITYWTINTTDQPTASTGIQSFLDLESLDIDITQTGRIRPLGPATGSRRPLGANATGLQERARHWGPISQ